MAIHERLDEELAEKSLGETYKFLGQGDTPFLYDKGFSIDTDHDIATGAASSIDRKIKYIDRTLYQAVMDGEYKVTNVRPRDIITAWLIHEHVEKVIIDGDNPIDRYEPGHQCALAKEHQFIKWLGGNIDKYEAAIWPGLVECYNNDKIERVPLDLWCGPLLDSPEDRDLEILKRYVKLGIKDASKYSKLEAQYGVTNHKCEDCSMWQADKLSQMNQTLALCSAVNGLVRSDRGCSLWRAAKRD
jgi:hypothetical protein